MWFLNVKDFEKENNTHSNVLLRFELWRARIDNNRREYWVIKLRKMVCMCVCSAFFFFGLHNCAMLQLVVDQHSVVFQHRPLDTTLVFIMVNEWMLCENRQQLTWILRGKCAKVGVHACVLRIFFILGCTTVQVWNVYNDFKKTKYSKATCRSLCICFFFIFVLVVRE